MQFASFRIGPERGGRGYRLLAATGLASDTAWTGNVPLVLLEWAKLRSPSPFVGRFPVTGGAVILRGRYAEEGTDGPIAFANGVFVPDAALDLVVRNEAALVKQITTGEDFGQSPVVVDDAAFAEPMIVDWPGLGLAWRDRQITLASDFDPEDVALKALASVVPLAQRRRITGWSTTSRLETRGDFAPIRGCKLLATGPSEPRGHQRFVPYSISADNSASGEPVSEPDAYRLWSGLLAAGRTAVPERTHAALDVAWCPAMADWAAEPLAGHYLHIVSQQGATFAEMVDAIGAVGTVCSDAVNAAMVQQYLDAVIDQPPAVIAGLLTRFAERFSHQEETLGVVHSAGLWRSDASLITQANATQLVELARTFARQTLAPPPVATTELALRRLRDFEDAALRGDAAGPHAGELRGALALARQWLGAKVPQQPHQLDRPEIYRALKLRRTNPLHPG